MGELRLGPVATLRPLTLTPRASATTMQRNSGLSRREATWSSVPPSPRRTGAAGPGRSQRRWRGVRRPWARSVSLGARSRNTPRNALNAAYRPNTGAAGPPEREPPESTLSGRSSVARDLGWTVDVSRSDQSAGSVENAHEIGASRFVIQAGRHQGHRLHESQSVREAPREDLVVARWKQEPWAGKLRRGGDECH